MADRIKGITVVLGGDTTGLNKALSGTNKQIKDTQSQLKDVERLLKLDPTNTKLLEQRQRLLADAVSETKTKLDTLKQAEKQVQEQFKKGEVSQQQYDGLQREIAATESELRKLETQAYKSNSAVAKIGDAAGKVKTGADKVSAAAGSVQQAFAPVTAAVAGLAGAAVATIPATEELRSDLSKLEASAEDNAVSAEAARDAWREFAVQSGETDSAVEATANLLQAGFTESNLQKAVEGLAGAAQRFPDTLKIEGLADSLQETLATGTATGQFGELLDRLGIGAEAFSEQLANCETEAEKQNLALETLANAGLNDSYNAWKLNNEEMLTNQEANLKLQESMAKLAETILPLATMAVEMVTELINWFTGLDGETQKLIATVVLFVAAISPVAGAISGISGAISFLIANPIVALIAAIVALVALIALKGDEIQAVLQKVDDFLQGVFATDWREIFGPVLGEYLNAFIANVKNVWDAVKRIFDGVIDFIRGVFTGNWERAWKGVQNIFGGIFDGLVTMAKAPLNGIIGLLNMAVNAINGLIDGFNGIGFDLPEWLGGGSWHPSIPTIPNIPYLAKGGTVLSGSAIVGEAGPELLTVGPGGTRVQPLTNSSTNNTANLGGVNITVYGAPGQSVNDLAEVIMDRIQTATMQKGAVFGA